MKNNYKYNAFISYRHVSPDKEIADKLQKKLENYKPPRSLLNGKRFDKLRIFRDETELPSSSNLSNDIKKALEDSEFLIVICSKTTGESRWCMEEIEYFKELHNGNNSNIITLVSDGNPEDVFPPALCNELIPVTDEAGNTTYQNHVIEPLAANVSGRSIRESFKKLNTEFLRVAAPLLGCGYDNLYNREHKKKIRRIFTVGSIVLFFLLLFVVYNSAMVLKINNQKLALAAANADLQKKTEELNLTNEDLKRSNIELENKTREAQANLAEATRQKKAAEDNLAEAEKQRKLAENNLAEAERQKKIAEDNLKEANRQKALAEENLAEATRQRTLAEENAKEADVQKTKAEENAKEANVQKAKAEENAKEANVQKAKAEENAKEANVQRTKAEENAKEANVQRAKAEENAKEANVQRAKAEENAREANVQRTKAEENAKEANVQRTKAEENAKEANLQKEIAEENMRTAKANEEKANEANRNLRIKNSEILAKQAKDHMNNNDIVSAVSVALEALSQGGDDIPDNATARYILADAVNAYGTSGKMVNSKINLSGYVKFMEFSEDGTRLAVMDTMGSIYIIDYDKKKIIKSYTPGYAFDISSDLKTDDICVDGNNAFALCNGQIISIDLKDGSIKWKYTVKDIKEYVEADTIVTNPKSDCIFLAGMSSYVLLTKDGQLLNYKAYKSDADYAYSEYFDSIYMDTDGTVYVVRPGTSDIYAIGQNGSKVYPVNIAKDDEIMCIGENDDCICLNIGVCVDGVTYSYVNGRMICFNKGDMSVKWTTDYTTESSMYSTFDTFYNTMFAFTNNIRNESGEIIKHNGMLVVSGTNILCFDKETGKKYFYVNTKYEDRILYCVPNTTEYSIKLATPRQFCEKVYLGKLKDESSGGSLVDAISYTEICTFAEEQTYIVFGGEKRYAMAPEKASEITLCSKGNFDNFKDFKNYPDIDGTPNLLIDDGQGVFAALYYKYVDGVKENSIVIYDAANNVCKAVYKDNFDISQMVLKNNKLLIFNNKGDSKVIDYSGKILEEFSLKDKIIKAAGFEESKYISFYTPYIYLSETNIVLCIGEGIYTIDLSGDKAALKWIVSGSNLKDYCITDNFASFTENSYKSNVTKIVCFKNGDKLSYVKDGGKDAEFVRGTVSSVVNTTQGYKIAFIAKEGYIGIYTYGGDSIMKISADSNSVNPLSVKFTSDGKYLIAMCADGRFIKYSVSDGSIAGEYKSGFEIDESSVFEFMDNESFLIKKYDLSKEIEIVDTFSMQKLADVNDFVKYLNSERIIICRRYNSGKYETGYFKYLTTSELTKLGKDFLNRK